jgi:comEA protein
MKPPRGRPELLLAAAALLVTAGVLLAVGLKGAPGKPEPPEETLTARANPFEFEVPGIPETTGMDSSYVIGYTGVVVITPGGDEIPPQPGEGAVAPPQVVQPPQQAQQPSYPVNLNTATQAQLETLPGIGPVKAQAILAWRAASGGFANANQLIEVKGIGQKTLEGLLPYITW